jgi:hypothetical protein
MSPMSNDTQLRESKLADPKKQIRRNLWLIASCFFAAGVQVLAGVHWQIKNDPIWMGYYPSAALQVLAGLLILRRVNRLLDGLEAPPRVEG